MLAKTRWRGSLQPMAGAFFTSLLIALGVPGEARAQDMSVAEFRAAAVGALGGEVTGIELTGSGWDACVGQAWSVTDGWARWEVTNYRRTIDYERGASMQSAQRRPEMDPGRAGGCGAQPDGPVVAQQTYVDDGAPWPQQLPIWLTPHGFPRLLEAGEAAIERGGDGWQAAVSIPQDAVTYRLVADYNGEFEIRQIETWIDDSIFGDMPVVAEFGDYRAFGRLSYPGSLTLKQGGFATLRLSLDDVRPNVSVERAEPRRGGARPGADDRPPFTQIGNGIFVVEGAYQAVAVEFEAFSVVIDGMQNDKRTREVIAVTKQAIPNKPIRYVVNTHSHFDHASGLRQFVADGATILTHESNVDFFRNALRRPRTLNPDAVRIEGMPILIEGISGRYMLADGSGQSVEIYQLEGSRHANDMLVAYLPSIRTVVEADVLEPWIDPRFGADRHPYLVHLADELERLDLDFEQFVPVHRLGPNIVMSASALHDAVD